MKKLILFSTILAGMVIFGCSTDNGAIEIKRKYAIQQVKDTYLKSNRPLPNRWGSNSLSALLSATVNTLKSPHCTSATITIDERGTCRLYVLWIESKPTVTSIEIIYDNGNSDTSIILPISNIDLREQKRASEKTVLIGSAFTFNSDSDFSVFANTRFNQDMKVRLWQGKKSVENLTPVSIFKVDRWMENKE